jgi:hypothetical protein
MAAVLLSRSSCTMPASSEGRRQADHERREDP